MKFVLSFIFCIILTYDVRAGDSLLYRSGFEERQIERTVHSSAADFIALFSAISQDSAGYLANNTRLNYFYNSLTPKVNESKSAKQKAKLIFKEVHAHFFRQYEGNVTFDRIFADGVYNCVTASMLYAIVLTRYGVPFEIKEKPEHVYLVAFPGADNILFETTNPRGIFAPDEKSKRDYVEAIVAMKFTTSDHVKAVGVSRAFNEFYYNNETISLVQLAGLQYYNLAIYQNDKNQTDESISSAIKLNMLYPSTKHQYLKLAYTGTAIRNSHFNTKKDILYLCEFAKASQDVSDQKMIVNTFEQLINEQLIKNSNEEFVTEAFNIIKGRIDDKSLLSEISYDYTSGMSHWLAMKGDHNRSLQYAEQAYAMNPKDVRIHEVIVRDIVLKTDKVKGKPKTIDVLNEYAVKFPFLLTHNTFRSFMIYQLAAASYGLFLDNSADVGYKYLDQMEKAIKLNNESASVSDQMIGMAYAEAGAYHFRKKQFSEAKKVILRGLEIVPDHGELKERLKIVEDEQK